MWGSLGYLRHEQPSRQTRLFEFIKLCLIDLSSEQQADSTHPSISMLMQGVQHRMDSVIAKTRREAMEIAEEFSKILDPSNPLRFEEDPDKSDAIPGSTGQQQQKDDDEKDESKEEEEEEEEEEEDRSHNKKSAALVLALPKKAKNYGNSESHSSSSPSIGAVPAATTVSETRTGTIGVGGGGGWSNTHRNTVNGAKENNTANADDIKQQDQELKHDDDSLVNLESSSSNNISNKDSDDAVDNVDEEDPDAVFLNNVVAKSRRKSRKAGDSSITRLWGSEWKKGDDVIPHQITPQTGQDQNEPNTPIKEQTKTKDKKKQNLSHDDNDDENNNNIWGGKWDEIRGSSSNSSIVGIQQQENYDDYSTEDDEDEEEDEDDDLAPIKETLDDNQSDLREVQPTKLLRDALDYLRNTKSQPHMEKKKKKKKKMAGVESLRDCIRLASVSTLRLHAVSLIKSIIHLWSVEVFEREKYDAMALGGLIALTKRQPEICVGVLQRVVFNSEHNLSQRILALQVIQTTARELSEIPLKTVGDDVRRKKIVSRDSSRVVTTVNALPTAAKSDFKNAAKNDAQRKRWQVIRERVEARTRRWGSTAAAAAAAKSSSREKMMITVNRFSGKLGGLFFFPILTYTLNMASRNESMTTMMMTSQKLNVLGNNQDEAKFPPESGQNHSGKSDPNAQLTGLLFRKIINRHFGHVQRWSHGLFELLLTTRFHNTNEIRRESLKALGRIFDSVSETQIRYALREELEESVEWILITSKMDPDDVSRSLAAAIASNLLKVTAIVVNTNLY
eukprot:jgi/Bigna1/128602/aug1.7_g3310